MTCSHCACTHQAGARFCRQCGANLNPLAGGLPIYPSLNSNEDTRRQRVRQHLQPLGISWMVYGVWRLFAGLMATLAFHLFAHQTFSDVPPFVTKLAGTVLPGVLGMLAVASVLAIITGYGLVTRRAWARIPAIVLGILALIKIPFGTALGVYTLWVLAPRVAGEEFETITQTA